MYSVLCEHEMYFTNRRPKLFYGILDGDRLTWEHKYFERQSAASLDEIFLDGLWRWRALNSC